MSFGGLLSGGLGLAKTAAGGKGGGKGGDSSGSSGSDPQSEYQHMQDLERIRDTYAKLGLTGSTMEAQDQAGAGLGFLANQAAIQNQNTQTGLNALNTLSGIQGQQNQQTAQTSQQAGAASVGGAGPGTSALF